MNAAGKSDKFIVPRKPPNKGTAQARPAEEVEGRDLAKGKAIKQSNPRTQSRKELSQALDRLRKVAKEDKEERFTAVWHHVYDRGRLREAFYGLKRKASPGVDGQSWKSYAENLEENLKALSERLKRGSYRAQPVKRIHIPKGEGRTRPIGITATEDKIVQRATVEVLQAIYEEDFLGFSYGFRPGRSQHNALDAVTVAITRRKIRWIFDADIRGFFDSMDHEWIERFVRHRIADRRVHRHIRKWLKAGVLEEEKWYQAKQGVAQGGSISPLLANLYLHYVLDQWAQWWRRTHACGEVILVRYADDFVVGFQHREDAQQFVKDLRERLEKFNLELNEEKSRLIEFGRFAQSNRSQRGEGKPETFNFLGFTHVCATTRKGKFCVKRRTMAKRMRAKLVSLSQTLRKRMHQSTAQVGAWLRLVLIGHYRYYGVPFNYRSLSAFRHQVLKRWRRVLRRRSQRRNRITWKRMAQLAERWLPRPGIVHPYPTERLAVRT